MRGEVQLLSPLVQMQTIPHGKTEKSRSGEENAPEPLFSMERELREKFEQSRALAHKKS